MSFSFAVRSVLEELDRLKSRGPLRGGPGSHLECAVIQLEGFNPAAVSDADACRAMAAAAHLIRYLELHEELIASDSQPAVPWLCLVRP